MNIDAAFQAIYGRAPRPDETTKLNRIAKELDIRDNDAIWAVAFLLGHYIDLAKQMPGQIEELTSKSLQAHTLALSHACEKAKADLDTIKSRIEENISDAVVTSAQQEIAAAAQKVARYAACKSWLQWLGGAAVVGMLFLAGAFYAGYSTGTSAGYFRALQVNSEPFWASTDIGQAAYQLYQSGDLESIVQCSRNGWRVERSHVDGQKLCIVHATSDGTAYGWNLPTK